jgi:4-aminobutyrate--pyruvate transaminase
MSTLRDDRKAAERDTLYHIHSQTSPILLEAQGPTVFTHGEGAHVFEEGGRRLIDAMAGLWCASLGFANQRLGDAAANQYRKMGFYHTFNQKTPAISIDLAEQLVRMSPFEGGRAYFATSGSEAIETMVKLAWLYHAQKGNPARRKIISRQRAFHGSTIVGASLTGLPRLHREFGLPLPGFLHTSCPDFYRDGRQGETEEQFVARLVSDLETMIEREGPETIAAFIAEPINAGGGVVVPPTGYFPAIQAVLQKYGILCLDDEIVCGFGRTGNMFGLETVGMKPDMMALAKGVTSSYFPLSAVIVSREIYESLREFNRDGSVFGHGFTNSGHPVGAAVALETLAIYAEMNVVRHVRERGKRLKDRLKAIGERSPIVGQVRGEGLMLAVEMVANKATRQRFDPKLRVGAEFDRRAQSNGLIIRPIDDTIALCPPYIISDADIDEIAQLFDKTLREVEGYVCAGR